jgi:hypothetical protein
MAGDIQIGAVEIKDGITNDRANVVPVSGVNALAVTDASEVIKSKVLIFGSALVAVGVTLTLATFTVPAGEKFIWEGSIVGGKGMGEFSFKVAGNRIALIRNSGSAPTIVAKFPRRSAPEASSTLIVTVEVKNIDHTPRDFEATLNGYTV